MSLLGGDALARLKSWHINIQTGLEQPKRANQILVYLGEIKLIIHYRQHIRNM